MIVSKEHALQELRDVTGRKVGDENDLLKSRGIKHGRRGVLVGLHLVLDKNLWSKLKESRCCQVRCGG